MTTLGYPDGQRVENADSPVQYQVVNQSTATQFTSGAIDVTRYDYLAGMMQSNVGQFRVLIGWYADQGLSIALAFRTFTIDSRVQNAGQFRIPNLGPWAWIGFYAISPAPSCELSTFIYGSNRVQPLEFIPMNPVLVFESNVSLPLSQSQNFWPTDYYAGPVNIIAYVTTSNWQITITAIHTDGTTRTVEVLNGSAASVWERFQSLTPPGAWYATMESIGAAGNGYLTITPSVTGST